MIVRVATPTDVAGMHRVRLAVRENRLTSTAITEAHYLPAIEQAGRGWVAVEPAGVLGFAIGNKCTGNIWALFVHPAHEGQGIGRALHAAMVQWLFAQGAGLLWLSTEPGTRAQRFYENAGWSQAGRLDNGGVRYELHAPGAA